jgi:hypothetical protein
MAWPVLAGGWTEHDVRATTKGIMTIHMHAPEMQIPPYRRPCDPTLPRVVVIRLFITITPVSGQPSSVF